MFTISEESHIKLRKLASFIDIISLKWKNIQDSIICRLCVLAFMHVNKDSVEWRSHDSRGIKTCATRKLDEMFLYFHLKTLVRDPLKAARNGMKLLCLYADRVPYIKFQNCWDIVVFF